MNEIANIRSILNKTNKILNIINIKINIIND